MKKAIYILLIFSFGFKCIDNNCELKDGKYKVLYDERFSNYPKFEFEVNGDYLIEINSDIKREFKIEYISKNSFQLKSIKEQKDSLSDFQKQLTSHGEPFYEITDCSKDTIDFVMRVNLNVISHSGKFIRVN